tara:strand:+ start:474 stop:791 length:318 start_codon:yes stop_codon:yes gene_type:complete
MKATLTPSSRGSSSALRSRRKKKIGSNQALLLAIENRTGHTEIEVEAALSARKSNLLKPVSSSLPPDSKSRASLKALGTAGKLSGPNVNAVLGISAALHLDEMQA